ncbi:MAG TPA: hypothetical protein VGM88_16880 [Kofleriaceae bacterium]|jgi:hypothetical protein
MSFQDFSSWPRDQEQAFVPFEQATAANSAAARNAALVAGVIGFLIVIGIFFGVEPDKKDLTKGMDMSNLTKKGQAAAAAAPAVPAPAPAAAPAAPAPAAPAPAPAEAPK